jgi:hypothetical protein
VTVNLPAEAQLPGSEVPFALGWTDGLPVVPPTPERVDEMLGSAVARRDEVIAVLPPTGGVATLEKIAANAVMAGCLPEYFPVVVAVVEAAADEAFHVGDLVVSVPAHSPLVLVSGPIARSLGMNGGVSALGAGCRANATIGRALALCLRNLARGAATGLDAAVLSHPGAYSYCFTENVELSPWPELSVDRGFATTDSTVTLFAAQAPLSLVHKGRLEPEAVLGTIADSIAIPGTYNAFFREELWLVMAPDHAGILGRAGWTKNDVARFLYEQARIPAGRLRERGFYGFADDAYGRGWIAGLPDDEPVPIADSPERFVVTVAGGEYGFFTAAVFGSGISVTRRVEELA